MQSKLNSSKDLAQSSIFTRKTIINKPSFNGSHISEIQELKINGTNINRACPTPLINSSSLVNQSMCLPQTEKRSLEKVNKSYNIDIAEITKRRVIQFEKLKPTINHQEKLLKKLSDYEDNIKLNERISKLQTKYTESSIELQKRVIQQKTK
ncbi:Hypothetical_protein [Hexamita inflata]|uniref:Hypothetical_protein n=1 Tax=Hexamita inflata TaxID=28002 RepID=A0AA86QN86_9EUKA|nr:Hypothetical protein HINF_LOCUS43779 [Hexamita inflata]